MAEYIEIMVGLPGNGKMEQLTEQFRQEALSSEVTQLNSRVLWVVPNQGRIEQVRRDLIGIQGNSFLNPNLYTFSRFADSIISASQLRVHSLSNLQKLRLLQMAIGENLRSNSIPRFQPIARTPGFLRQADEFITEMKRNDVWSEHLAQSSVPVRERELVSIYRSYQGLLHQGNLYDDPGRFWLAREILGTQSEDQLTYELMVFQGFSDFTETQYDILKLLERVSRKVIVSIDMDPKAAANDDKDVGRTLLFSKPYETLKRLQQIWPQAKVRLFDSGYTPTLELGRIRERLFSDDHDSQDWSGDVLSVEMLGALSVQDEILEVGDRIKELLLTKQGTPNEILVVHPQLESISERIKEVFEDYGIPYSLELPKRLSSCSMVRLLTQLLLLRKDNWAFGTLLSVVGNRSLALFDDEANGDSIRIAVEQCLRAAQLPADKDRILGQVRRWANQGLPKPEETQVSDLPSHIQLAPLALVKLELLSEILDALPYEATVDKWVEAIEILLGELRVRGQDEQGDEHLTKTWSLLVRSLRSVHAVEVWSEKSLSTNIQGFLQLLELVARNTYLPRTQESVGRVRVLQPESSRGLFPKHLFFMGLGESALKFQERTESIDLVTAASESVSDLQSSAHVHAMHLFYEVLIGSKSSITLSYVAFDDKAQPLLPCSFLDDVRRCFGRVSVPLHVKKMGSLEERQSQVWSYQSYRRLAMRKALDGEPSWLETWNSDPQLRTTGAMILDGLMCVSSRSQWNEFGPYEGLMVNDFTQDSLAKRFDSRYLWSPSQLESYASCPFRFLSEQILRLKPLSDLTLQSDAARRGSLLHQVLAEIHEQLRVASTTDGEDRNLLERFLVAMEKYIESNPLAGLEESLREIERREIEAWAPNYVEQEHAYREAWKSYDDPPQPKYLELRFGDTSSTRPEDNSDNAFTEVPFELDLGEEKILLTGQIDRVDVGQIGGVTIFNIIDYKSGKSVRKLETEKVASGQQLQLPLYALAVEGQLLAGQNARAMSAGYWNVRKEGYETHKKATGFPIREVHDQVLTETQEWEVLIPKMLERVSQIVSGIRQGHFPVYNEDKNCTSFCTLSTMCRIGQIRSMEKLWVDGDYKDE